MAKKRAPRGPSDEVLLKQAENRHEVIVAIRWAIILFFTCVALLCTVPLASTIAGTTTKFDASVTINISVVLGITQAATGAALVHQRRTAKQLRRRNEALEKRVKQLDHLDRRDKNASDSLEDNDTEEVTS